MSHEVAADTRTSAYWDAIGHEWTHAQRDALWRAYCDRRNAQLVSRWMHDTPRTHVLKTDVFDEAVSEGLCGVLRRYASRVSALDVSRVMLDAARARNPGMGAVTADVRSLPFATGAFDAVISISTLDHFDSLDAMREALVELRRVLRDGGGLLVTIDNDAQPIVALRNRLPFGLLNALGLVPYRTGRTCDARTLRRLLASSGFDVRELTHVEHCPRVLVVPVARVVARLAPGRIRSMFLRTLERFERLERWPSRAVTGHYVAAWALRR